MTRLASLLTLGKTSSILLLGLTFAIPVTPEQSGCGDETDSDGDGYSLEDGDCNDQDPSVNPGAEEVCDDIDNNCNNQVDEGLELFYPDADGDQFGDAMSTSPTCQPMPGYVNNHLDCNDSDALINPSASESCDGLDNDCDGRTDEGVTSTYYADSDGDGYGDPDVSVVACTAPTGYVGNSGDCDDANGNVHPGAAEACNGIDDDCDGYADGEATGEVEPNNELAQAQDLGDLNGVDTPVVYTRDGTIDTSADTSDFYKLYLTDDFAIGSDLFYIEVTLTTIPSGSNYDLYLWWDDPEDFYFEDIQVIEQSTNSSNFDEAVLHSGDSGPENGGYFWIEVRRASGSNCTSPYHITIENMG